MSAIGSEFVGDAESVFEGEPVGVSASGSEPVGVSAPGSEAVGKAESAFEGESRLPPSSPSARLLARLATPPGAPSRVRPSPGSRSVPSAIGSPLGRCETVSKGGLC